MRQLQSQVAERLPRAVYQRGTTLDLFIEGATLDVLRDLFAAERPREEKLAQFIDTYFCEGRTITDITLRVLGLLDRSRVSQSYRVDACDRVAHRFLTLVESADPLADSAGVREALDRQELRWSRARLRVTETVRRLHVRRYGAPVLPAAEG